MNIRVEGKKTHLLPEPDSGFDNEMKLANEMSLSKIASIQISDKKIKLGKGTSSQDSNNDNDDKMLVFFEEQFEEQIIMSTVAKLKEYQDLRKESVDEEYLDEA